MGLNEKVGKDLTRVRILAEWIPNGAAAFQAAETARAEALRWESAYGCSRNSKEASLTGDKKVRGETLDPGQGGNERSLLLFFYLFVWVSARAHMCVHCKCLSLVCSYLSLFGFCVSV